MRYVKTYGARGVLEWHMMLRAGKARLLISFTGGRMGSNGVIPAKYVTGSRAVQQLIEGSRYFKCGKVYLHGAPVEIKEERVCNAAIPEDDTQPIIINRDESADRAIDQESFPDDGGDALLEC